MVAAIANWPSQTVTTIFRSCVSSNMQLNPREIVNPKPFLLDLVGKPVVVRLKWGMEYKGSVPRKHLSILLFRRGSPYSDRIIVLRFRLCHTGILTSIDNYMNVELRSAEEWIDGALAGKLGDEVLIRCNNVLHIRGAAFGDEAALGNGSKGATNGKETGDGAVAEQ